MTHRNISSQELRSASFPTSKSGYTTETVDAVIQLCADSIEDLENQVTQLQNAVAMARSESAPMELAYTGDDEDVIAQWLTTLNPLDISQEVQKNIAEAIVESTMAASHIRSEARERVKALIDAVALEVQKLMIIIKDSRVSVAATNDLPNALAIWQGEFSSRIGVLLQQLQLPWTVQVSQLAKVLAHMAEHELDAIHSQENTEYSHEAGSSIKRRQSTPHNNEDGSPTTRTIKGQWG